jgi:hypothetical protein
MTNPTLGLRQYGEAHAANWRYLHQRAHERYLDGKVNRINLVDTRRYEREHEGALVQRGEAARKAFLRKHPDQLQFASDGE